MQLEGETRPCPGCGEDIRVAVADAYTWLYGPDVAKERRWYASNLEANLYWHYGAVVSAALATISGHDSADLVEAARHKLNDE